MRRVVLGAVLLVFSAACEPAKNTTGGSSTVPSPGPATGPTAATTADLVFCVNETNKYRTSNGRPEVARSSALEAFAAEGANEDAGSTTPHQHFNRTRGGNGTAFAENELHRVATSFFKSTQDAIAQGIAGFYGEGPSGGHFQNLVGPYSLVGCGVFVGNGQITFVQDFR